LIRFDDKSRALGSSHARARVGRHGATAARRARHARQIMELDNAASMPLGLECREELPASESDELFVHPSEPRTSYHTHMRAPESAFFVVGESVLAFHGPLLNHALVVDVLSKPTCLCLLRHAGWPPEWDHWVAMEDVLKVNEANLEIQRVTQRGLSRGPPAPPPPLSPPPGLVAKRGLGRPPKKPRRVGRADEASLSEPRLSMHEAREALPLPQPLRHLLYSDWEQITRERRLVPLPLASTPTVAALLDEFAALRRGSPREQPTARACDAARSYFDDALEPLLLYEFEERQHAALLAHGRSPAEVYGAEHLLRLLLKMPELLPRCEMGRARAHLLLAELGELVQFLQADPERFFVRGGCVA